MTEVENSCSFINNIHEKHSEDLRQAQSEVKNLQTSCNFLEENVKSLHSERDQLKTKLTDLEARSMRDNLMFYGLKETKDENCETLVKDFCTNKLEIEGAKLVFDRVHRVGGNTAKKPRPIVAKFHYYSEREAVLTAAGDRSDDLKQENTGVGIQRPKAVRGARRNLYATMKRARDQGNTARFVGEKLFINGREYVDDNGR